LVVYWREKLLQVGGVEHLGDSSVLMFDPLSAEAVDSDEDGQQPEFSLVTGQYRKAKRFGSVASPVSDESSAVVLRNNEGAVSILRDSAAGAYCLKSGRPEP
jgi:hypothetical protein